MSRSALVFALFSSFYAQQVVLERRHIVEHTLGASGAVPDPSRKGWLLVWGSGLHAVPLRGGPSVRLLEGPFGEGGCLMDADGDGRPGLIVQHGAPRGRLVWIRPPFRQVIVIDDEVEMHDCREATLFGRRGLLMIQRHAQVRFYEYPGRPGIPWPYREIYSIYTASRQTGLALADVDGDRLPDIFCGNYWIRSPGEFDLPWRLFAINLWHEQPDSAMVRLAAEGDSLLAAQGHSSPARVSVFRKTDPPTEQWLETRLDVPGGIRFPHGLARVPAGSSGAVHFIGENNGPQSRLFWIENLAAPVLRSVPAGVAIHTLIAADLDGDGQPELVAAGPRAVAVWSVHLRK